MSEEVKKYLTRHSIPQTIETLASMLIKDTPEKPLDAMAQWLQLQGGVGTDAYNLRTKARIAQFTPYAVQVEAGKTYYYCTCGYSKNQPFCDGAHTSVNERNGTKFAPLPYQAKEATTLYFCGCKATKNPPMCDGSHVALPKVTLNVFMVSPNAMAVLCFIRDANIPCVVNNIPPGEHKKEEYLKKFPLGQVPSLTDPTGGPDGTEFNTFESCSILRYLCNRFMIGAPWYPTEPAARARVDRMLDWRQTSLFSALIGVSYPFLGFKDNVESEVERCKKDLTTICETFTSKLLEGKKFVGGDQPCIADYIIGCSLAVVPACPTFHLPAPMQDYFNRFKSASANYSEVMQVLEGFVASKK